jgi:hypothetical protein
VSGALQIYSRFAKLATLNDLQMTFSRVVLVTYQ